MSMADESRESVDPRIDTPAREGLTGTAPASVYGPLRDAEQVTIAPDGRPMDEQPAWRTDFPIDWPEDHYVERRDFMKFMVLTSLAFAVGQFWIAGQNWVRRRRGQPAMRRVASIDEVAVGAAVTFSYPLEHDDCVLVRTGANAFVAYGLQCPCHEGSFDLSSGRPVAGPPRRPLDRVRIQIVNRDIYATGVEERTT
jgi:hypothetical protein